MRVEIYFSSNRCDEASIKSYFQLPFEWSAIPTIGTETAVPVESNRGAFVVKGVLKDVRVTGNLGKALFGTETPSEDLREAILPGGFRLKEKSDWLE